MSNYSKPTRWQRSASLLLLLLTITSCDNTPKTDDSMARTDTTTETTQTETRPASPDVVIKATPVPRKTAPPPRKMGSSSTAAARPPAKPDVVAPTEPSAALQFNLDKLKDRSYTKPYGDGFTFYTAAEELGKLGKPAVPPLIKKLDTQDPHELKLALYALELATQDPQVTSKTRGEYIELIDALDEANNAANKQKALEWWSNYQQAFVP